MTTVPDFIRLVRHTLDLDDDGHDIYGSGGSSGPGLWAQADCGMAGDGSTDDTVAYQACIVSATASGTKSGAIKFEPGTYLIGGPLVDTGAFNGQIVLPSVSTSDSQVVLRLQGATRPPFAQHGTEPIPDGSEGYSILKSTLTGASGTAACISGGNSGLNNVSVVIENIISIGPADPSFTFWNLEHTQGGSIPSLFGAAPWPGLSVEPTHSNAYFIKLPGDTQSNGTSVGTILGLGWYTAVKNGELVHARELIAGVCVVALETPSLHFPFLIDSLTATGCTYGHRPTGDCYGKILEYSGEHYEDTSATPDEPGAWYNTIYDLDDPSNHFHGDTGWVGIEWAVGNDHTFTVNGGANSSNAEIGPLTAGAPTTVDYLVGTASGALSGEIVAGTTPGGELGGTWGSPTVDTTHSGSSHAAAQAAAEATAAAALAAHVASSGAGSDHDHIIDVFNGDGSLTTFELSEEPLDPEAVYAFVAGAWTAVAISGAMNTIATFGSAPGSGTGNVAIQYPAAAA